MLLAGANATRSRLSSSEPAETDSVELGGCSHFCSADADCPLAQYCAQTRCCRACTYLRGKVPCDELFGDCCSAAFRRNCPTNPKAASCGAPVPSPPSTPCEMALQGACGALRGAAFDCTMCAGRSQQLLRHASCTNTDIQSWCSDAPPAPPPPSPARGGGFPRSRLLTSAWGRKLNSWAGRTSEAEWSLCCSTFEGCDTAAKFHAGCDAHKPTLTVAHNAGDTHYGEVNPGNYTFGGFVRTFSCIFPSDAG